MNADETWQWILILALIVMVLLDRRRIRALEDALRQNRLVIKSVANANDHNVLIIDAHTQSIAAHDQGLRAQAQAISTMTQLFVEEKRS